MDEIVFQETDVKAVSSQKGGIMNNSNVSMGLTTNDEILGKRYLDFVLNPDCHSPVRMPAKFTFPTNLVSYKNNFTLTVGPMGDFCGYFSPQSTMALKSSVGFYDYAFYTQSIVSAGAYSNQNYLYMSLPGSPYSDYQGNSLFPYNTLFRSFRVIGAVCEISDMSPMVNKSGSYIVSARMYGQNSPPAGGGVGIANTPGTTGFVTHPTIVQQFNENIFKKYDADDTIRMVWFPVDSSCGQFQVTSVVPTPDVMNVSHLQFFISGYGLLPSASLDVRIQIFYEAIPNVANSALFAGSQEIERRDWWTEWEQLHTVARDGLGQVLLTGVKLS